MQAVNASTTGPFLAVGANQQAMLDGVVLTAAAADATAIVREYDGSGRILCSLAALAKTTEQFLLPVDYKGNVHVTVAGAGATVMVYQR